MKSHSSRKFNFNVLNLLDKANLRFLSSVLCRKANYMNENSLKTAKCSRYQRLWFASTLEVRDRKQFCLKSEYWALVFQALFPTFSTTVLLTEYTNQPPISICQTFLRLPLNRLRIWLFLLTSLSAAKFLSS